MESTMPLQGIITSTCHNHTTFCDGKNTPHEMAQAALAAGFTDLGFSAHSRTCYAQGANFGVEDESAYVQALHKLRTQMAGQLAVAIGIEQDYYAPVKNRGALDYLIGSVHDIFNAADGAHYCVDGSLGHLTDCCNALFGGDMLALVRHFYALTVQNVQENTPDIVGHFDLISKNNANGALFDEQSSAYRCMALEALDACLEKDVIFEVNTGGMFRGYLQRPYPAPFLLRRLQEKGARIMLNADAHETAALTHAFVPTLALLREIGFRELTLLEKGAFVQKAL